MTELAQPQRLQLAETQRVEFTFTPNMDDGSLNAFRPSCCLLSRLSQMLARLRWGSIYCKYQFKCKAKIVKRFFGGLLPVWLLDCSLPDLLIRVFGWILWRVQGGNKSRWTFSLFRKKHPWQPLRTCCVFFFNSPYFLLFEVWGPCQIISLSRCIDHTQIHIYYKTCSFIIKAICLTFITVSLTNNPKLSRVGQCRIRTCSSARRS